MAVFLGLPPLFLVFGTASSSVEGVIVVWYQAIFFNEAAAILSTALGQGPVYVQKAVWFFPRCLAQLAEHVPCDIPADLPVDGFFFVPVLWKQVEVGEVGFRDVRERTRPLLDPAPAGAVQVPPVDENPDEVVLTSRG